MQYVVINRVYVTENYAQEFENRFHNRAGQIEQQPGFVRFQMFKPTTTEGAYLIITIWQDENAFNNWVKSEDFKIAHQNPMPKAAFRQEGSLERYHSIIETDKN